MRVIYPTPDIWHGTTPTRLGDVNLVTPFRRWNSPIRYTVSHSITVSTILHARLTLGGDVQLRP